MAEKESAREKFKIKQDKEESQRNMKGVAAASTLLTQLDEGNKAASMLKVSSTTNDAPFKPGNFTFGACEKSLLATSKSCPQNKWHDNLEIGMNPLSLYPTKVLSRSCIVGNGFASRYSTHRRNSCGVQVTQLQRHIGFGCHQQ